MNLLSVSDWQALLLSFEIAGISTVILCVICLPLAWWLYTHSGWYVAILQAIATLPAVLPPTVLGFYLLIFFSPTGIIGTTLQQFRVQLLFTKTGLIIASVLYSLPFALQPLMAAQQHLGTQYLELAASLSVSKWQTCTRIWLPLMRPGINAAVLLSFAHTVGEFGVVLMIGGSIPNQTKMVSIVLFEYVELLDYQHAHQLALLLVCISALILSVVYFCLRNKHVHHSL